MGNGDNRYGDDRWQGRGERGGRWERERGGPGGWGSDRERGSQNRGSDNEDRGFFERAGDEVRSWFGDEDERGGYGRNQPMGGGQRRGASFGGGFGNQQGWGDDHFDRQFGSDRDADPAQRRYSEQTGPTFGGGGGGADTRGGSGFGGLDDTAKRPGRGGRPQSGGMGGDHHDPHYSEWRRRQMEQLDRDYHEYRQEHQSKFEQEFGGWREKRQTQRQHMGRATEQMEVVGSDGQHIGTVDKVRGDRILLTKSDPNAGGIHHSIPCSWIESVDERVTVNKTAEDAMKAWKDEEQNRALFEREDQGSEGPHILNRSFSGTYSDREE